MRVKQRKICDFIISPFAAVCPGGKILQLCISQMSKPGEEKELILWKQIG